MVVVMAAQDADLNALPQRQLSIEGEPAFR